MDDDTWLLGNINQTGYFRVNYDLQNWKLLIQQLHSNPQVTPPLGGSLARSSVPALIPFLLFRSSLWETGRDLSTTPST